MIYIAIVAALAAGALFAVGGVIQQREASTTSSDESLSPKLLVDLARRPAWLAGIGTTAGSFLFKAVALAFGPLAIVQPLIASELIFAIPASVRRHKMRLHRREWGGIAMVTIGLVVGIVAADPQQGHALPSLLRWGELLGGLAVIAGLALLAARWVKGTSRASLYAMAAVATLVAQGALLSATVALFKMGLVTALTSWEPYAMAVVSIVALTLVQSAYQAGPLAASMPVMDAANPVLAIIVGIVFLDESINTGPWNVAGAVAGVLLLVAGIIIVDTSPLVLRVQRIEDEEQEEQEEAAEDQDGTSDEDGASDQDRKTTEPTEADARERS